MILNPQHLAQHRASWGSLNVKSSALTNPQVPSLRGVMAQAHSVLQALPGCLLSGKQSVGCWRFRISSVNMSHQITYIFQIISTWTSFCSVTRKSILPPKNIWEASGISSLLHNISWLPGEPPPSSGPSCNLLCPRSTLALLWVAARHPESFSLAAATFPSSSVSTHCDFPPAFPESAGARPVHPHTLTQGAPLKFHPLVQGLCLPGWLTVASSVPFKGIPQTPAFLWVVLLYGPLKEISLKAYNPALAFPQSWLI